MATMVGVEDSFSGGVENAKLLSGATYGTFDDSLALDDSAKVDTFGAATEAAAELAPSDCAGLTEGALLLTLKIADLW